jgi:hypothetical protein
MSDADRAEVVNDLVHIGRTWSGILPAPLSDASTRRRIRGAAFSFLVMVDGDAGTGPMRLSPRDNGDVDLGGQALHELLGSDPIHCDNDEQRRLLANVQQLVDTHADNSGPVRTVMGQFLAAICRLLAAGYELRLVHTDWDTGEDLAEGDDIAAGLPAAFASAWGDITHG